eukprot:6453044-Alexandrium_andersonii.AAC.1
MPGRGLGAAAQRPCGRAPPGPGWPLGAARPREGAACPRRGPPRGTVQPGARPSARHSHRGGTPPFPADCARGAWGKGGARCRRGVHQPNMGAKLPHL